MKHSEKQNSEFFSKIRFFFLNPIFSPKIQFFLENPIFFSKIRFFPENTIFFQENIRNSGFCRCTHTTTTIFLAKCQNSEMSLSEFPCFIVYAARDIPSIYDTFGTRRYLTYRIRYSIFDSILDTCSPKYRLTGQRFIRYSIYRSIAIPPIIDIERSRVSRYFDISSIEPALTRGRAINIDWRRSMTRSTISKEIVRLVAAINDRSYVQSWSRRSIVRSMVEFGVSNRLVVPSVVKWHDQLHV